MDGEVISIKVVKTSKGRCRLLIEAPDKCRIIRQELEDYDDQI
jgi:sRNA-binding carbon storage regulator CsrA